MQRPLSSTLWVCLCVWAAAAQAQVPAVQARPPAAAQAQAPAAQARPAAVQAPAAPLAQAPDPSVQGPVFRAEVDLVLQAVAVLDRDGNPVTDLGRDEFVVYEDGEPQEIRLFLTPEIDPLDVAVVLDGSGSLAPWSHLVRRAVKTFLASLQPDDCVYLLPFNARVGPGLWGRAHDPIMARRVDAIFFDGGTALYDAVWDGLETIERMSLAAEGTDGTPQASSPAGEGVAGEAPRHRSVTAAGSAASGAEKVQGGIRPGAAVPRGGSLTRGALQAGLERLASQAARELGDTGTGRAGCGGDPPANAGTVPRRRRAVVVFSDGDDEDSNVRLDQLVERAGAAAIPVFPVLLGQARESIPLKTVLERLAAASGGTVIQAASPETLRAAFEDVVALLRASYLLGYPPPPDTEGRWHEVRVRSRRPSYRLVYRERYHR